MDIRTGKMHYTLTTQLNFIKLLKKQLKKAISGLQGCNLKQNVSIRHGDSHQPRYIAHCECKFRIYSSPVNEYRDSSIVLCNHSYCSVELEKATSSLEPPAYLHSENYREFPSFQQLSSIKS